MGDEVYWLPAVSYLNFFISNKIVLVPQYWKTGMPESERLKDVAEKATLTRLFPGKTIVQINPVALNKFGGGVHCATATAGTLTTKPDLYKKDDVLDIYYLQGNPKRNTMHGAWHSKLILGFGIAIALFVLFAVYKIYEMVQSGAA